MTASKGWYSLLQFCPDASRAEAANVGVVLFCPERGFLRARTAQGNDRIRRFFGSATFDRLQINEAKRAIEERLEIERDRFRTLDDLRAFIEGRSNDLLLTAPREMRVEDPTTDLDQLFEELVGGRSRTAKSSPELSVLDDTFVRLASSTRVQTNVRFSIPVIGRDLVAKYAYRNGALNLVRPTAFAPDVERATNVAMLLAIEGDLIRKHPAAPDEPARLVVVSAIETQAAADAIEPRLAPLLGEYEVRFVQRAEISSFASEVEREVRRHAAD